jgi:hypothetical protein
MPVSVSCLCWHAIPYPCVILSYKTIWSYILLWFFSWFSEYTANSLFDVGHAYISHLFTKFSFFSKVSWLTLVSKVYPNFWVCCKFIWPCIYKSLFHHNLVFPPMLVVSLLLAEYILISWMLVGSLTVMSPSSLEQWTGVVHGGSRAGLEFHRWEIIMSLHRAWFKLDWAWLICSNMKENM